MSELLLQTIVEKLESLELAWKVSGHEEKSRLELLRNDIGIVRSELKKLPVQPISETALLEQLSDRLESLNKQLLLPTKNYVQHKHELHKGVFISVFLFMVTILLTCLLINSYQNNQQYLANDLKYRYVKLAGTALTLKLCNLTDSLYQTDKTLFRINVEQEEQRLIQQVKDLRLAEEKEREAKFLKNRAGRR